MAWFNFLKGEGYFDPEKNPEPVKVKDGFQIPYWDALGYLEKLSFQMSQGKETELLDDLLEVIKNVSEHPKENSNTWYSFLKILSNLPNEKISKEILNFVPVWFSGRFDTMLQTSELCNKLLPKFLSDNPSKSDIEKAELILHFLFQANKTENQVDVREGNGYSYYSKFYLYYLSHQFGKNDFIINVVKYCSSNIILELGRTIKFLLLDYPRGLKSTLKEKDNEYEITIFIEPDFLLVQSSVNGSLINIEKSKIENWEEKDEAKLKKELIKILKKQKINFTTINKIDDTFNNLISALNTDIYSSFGLKSIKKLDDQFSNDESLLDVFSLIFRDLLVEKTKQYPENSVLLLKTLCNDKKYYIPFFKRVSLYVIAENWNETKSLFWELLKDKDSLGLFSNFMYQRELYHLLNKNQLFLLKSEKEILIEIINKGEVGVQKDKKNEYEKLRWYSALKDIKPFNKKYVSLSKSLNITNEHYVNLGEVRIKSGSISPISKDDLLEKSNAQIAEFIKTFNPKDRWEDPNVSGLSYILGSAVETQPEKFADEIELYQDVAYIYTYRILNAFGEAWKKQKTFNWANVLQYCLHTIKSKKFYSGELKIENDTWNATEDWVVGSISHLITDGLQNDRNAFDISLLPLVKEILTIIVSNLKRVDDFKGTNMDYPTYSYNSTAGKSLRAMFDYSLHRSRNLFLFQEEGKWEPEIQSLFENALQKGILDAYILQGMYFEQFYFLDKDWITEQIKKHYKSEEREWLAFISGFAFGKPPFNKELYLIFYPHYERVFENNTKLNYLYNNGLIRHLTAFYFWKYETLESKKLLFKFLNQSSHNDLSNLISFIGQQKDYSKSLNELEQKEFQKSILVLWEFLVEKYKNTNIAEEQKNLGLLSNWVFFVTELNENFTNLILESSKYVHLVYATSQLLEKLTNFKNKGNPKIIAKSLGVIIQNLDFKGYISELEKENIKDLVIFLFDYGEDIVASKFCNKMASSYNQFFLKEIYFEKTANKSNFK